MTREEFEVFKFLYAKGGQPLKKFLQEIGVPYTIIIIGAVREK